MQKPTNSTSNARSYILIIIGALLITLWIFATKPWEKAFDTPLMIFINDALSYITAAVLLLGIVSLITGLIQLFHTSWSRKGNK